MIEALGTITLIILIALFAPYFLKNIEDPKLEATKNEIRSKILDRETNHEIFKEYQWIVEKIFNENNQYSYKDFLQKIKLYKEDFSEMLLLSRFYNAGLVGLVEHKNLNIIFKKGEGYLIPENIFPETIGVLKSLRLQRKFTNPQNLRNALECKLLVNVDSQVRYVSSIIFGIYSGQFIVEKIFDFHELDRNKFYFVIYCNVGSNYLHLIRTSLQKTENGTFYSTPLLIGKRLLNEKFFVDSLDNYVRELGINNFEISGYKN